MNIDLWECDHKGCKAIVSTVFSIDMAVAGWACTEEGKSYCPKHREKYAPGIFDTQTTDNYLALIGLPRKQPTNPPFNFKDLEYADVPSVH